MSLITDHLTRSFVAGIVALLPVGGLILTVVTIETTISESWLADQAFYVPGLGLLAVVIGVYLIGVAVSNVLGQWAWGKVDGLLDRLPGAGQLYRTLKQILGYGEGHDAVFQRVVLVPCEDFDAVELGLVTSELKVEDSDRLVVFVPGAPNPTAGRLILVAPDKVRPSELSVHEVLKAMVSLGKI